MSKDWENAPKGYEESDAPRALEIKRLIRAESLPRPIAATAACQDPTDEELEGRDAEPEAAMNESAEQ